MSKFLEEKDKFVLGTRLFNTKETPLRNKTGNRITSRLFKKLYNVYIKDTQSGLRAIPNRLIKNMLEVDMISIDIKNALDYILEIVGKSNTELVIDRLFQRFCLGK